MTPDERSEWIKAWIGTPAAIEQWYKQPKDRICPVCSMTCRDFYRFAVPCNPERDQESHTG